MIRPLRIIADDLTGALDAAAPFASAEGTVEVPWDGEPEAAAQLVAVTSESRNADRLEAVERTTRAVHRLGAGPPGALWFKKVDSVLRGNPIAETAAMFRAGRFTRCVFAPAFPEMGRVTRGGCQVLLGAEGNQPVGPPDIVAAFAREGLAAAVGGPDTSGATVLVADAETPDDLLALARAHARWDGVLWAGSRGLAAALAGPLAPRLPPPIGLIVVGTSHQVTRRQVRVIEPLVVRAMPGVALSFDVATPRLIDPVADAPDELATRRVLLETLSHLTSGGDRRAGLIIVGGDTLSTVLEATRTHSLQVLGEVGPGVPLMQVHGGDLDGRLMVTKSGGFGSPELLGNLLAGHTSSYA